MTDDDKRRRANIRLGLLLGALAVGVFVLFFWTTASKLQ